jgi:[ribosomal protein S5]-alanine N-acetyltransferase
VAEKLKPKVNERKRFLDILTKARDHLFQNKREFTICTETDRLLIRPLRKADYSNWLNEFNNRLPSQHKHDKGRMNMNNCSEHWFAQLVKDHQELALKDQAYIFGVFRKEDNVHLGMVDFSTLARENFQWGRIGYSIHNQFWRQGYGQEAVFAALLLAFSELHYHRIEAHINVDNLASIELAKRVGMEFECIRKAFLFESGEWTDHRVYYKNAPYVLLNQLD